MTQKASIPPICLVALFGSRARGDSTCASDIDLLFVTDEDRFKWVSKGRVSVHHYPWSELKKSAEHGDLFACHLVREAKSLFDPQGLLSALSDTFSFKASYSTEIEHASDLGWFLVRYAARLESSLAVKRVVWCVRTILIALAAQRREPVFSSKELAAATACPAARRILNRRHAKVIGKKTIGDLAEFLEWHRHPESARREFTVPDYIGQFRSTENHTALATIRGAVSEGEYGISWKEFRSAAAKESGKRLGAQRKTRSHISAVRNDGVVLTLLNQLSERKNVVNRVAVRFADDDFVVESRSRTSSALELAVD